MGGGAVMVAGSSSGKSSDPTYITDEVMEKFGRLNHVSGVSPILDMNVVIRQGAYEAQYMTLRGVGQKFLEQIPLGEGRLPGPGETGLVLAIRYSRIFIIPRQEGDTGIQVSFRMWTSLTSLFSLFLIWMRISSPRTAGAVTAIHPMTARPGSSLQRNI